jgi:aldehyde dehydrogenase (NAD+)
MIVEESIYEKAVSIAAEVAESIKVSSGHEAGRHIGPVVSEVQFDKIQNLINKGVEEGAKLVAGGPGRPEGLNRGYYFNQTVFGDIKQNLPIYKEKIFGQVLSLRPFTAKDNVVNWANNPNYD